MKNLHSGVDSIHSRAESIHSGVDLFHSGLKNVRARVHWIHSRVVVFHAVVDFIGTRMDGLLSAAFSPVDVRRLGGSLPDAEETIDERERKSQMADKKIMALPHSDEAKVFLDKIRALRDELPRLNTTDATDGRTLSALTRVPDAFLESASVLVQTSPRMENAVGVNAITLRDSYGYSLAYGPVVQELYAVGDFLAHSIRLERAAAAASALDVYAVAARLSKQAGGAELKPHVDDMRSKLGKKRVRKADVALPPAAAVPDDE